MQFPFRKGIACQHLVNQQEVTESRGGNAESLCLVWARDGLHDRAACQPYVYCHSTRSHLNLQGQHNQLGRKERSLEQEALIMANAHGECLARAGFPTLINHPPQVLLQNRITHSGMSDQTCYSQEAGSRKARKHRQKGTLCP